MRAGWGSIRQINIAMLVAVRTVMRGIGHQEINRMTGGQIAEIMQRALSGCVARGKTTAPRTRGLLMVAMVRHLLRRREIVDVDYPLGGVWRVSARSVHDGLPEEKRLEAEV
jgi:hypothetical protein